MDGILTQHSYFGGGSGWLHLVVRGTHFGVVSVGGGGEWAPNTRLGGGLAREGGVRRRGVEMVPGKVKSPKSYRTT